MIATSPILPFSAVLSARARHISCSCVLLGADDADEFMTKRLLIPVLEERRDWSPTVETSSLLPIGDMDVSSASIESEVKVVGLSLRARGPEQRAEVGAVATRKEYRIYVHKAHSSLRCLPILFC